MPTHAPETDFEQLVHDLTPRYGTGEAQSIARIVFEDAFGARKPFHQPLSPENKEQLALFRQQLVQGKPVQYVLGQADFFGLKFAVNSAVLIPRQETEELVAEVLDWLKKRGIQSPTLLDIGLGSGCIAITLKHKRRDLRLFGLEKSPDALALATANARGILGNPDFLFFPGDILHPRDWPALPAFDVIVSNPPYIPHNQRDKMPEHVLAHEPELALFVENDDPLVFYRAISAFALENLQPGGALFFECNEFNAGEVVDLLVGFGFIEVALKKDLSGADRIVAGVLPN